MSIKRMFIVCLAIIALGSFTLAYAHSDDNYVHSDLFETLQEGDKVALLMVHFGTTHDDTRSLTIDAINQKAKEAFPNMEFREAYTSRIVLKRMAQNGIKKQNPVEALAQLKAEGYTHVVVQSTNIIDGIEMDALRKDVAQMSPLFKEIRIGAPLLYSTEDYQKVITALLEKKRENCITLLVGHGTYTPATAQYAMLDYMFHAEGHDDFIVGTVEGYPSFDDAINRLKEHKDVKNVQLVPFMLVAGDHAQNDIAGDMKTKLEQQGYQVSVVMEGLGQSPEIQNLFIEHARFMTTHRLLDILDKKRAYSESN